MQTYKKVIIICVILSVLIIFLYIYFFFLPKKADKKESSRPPVVEETLTDKIQDSEQQKNEKSDFPALDIPLKNSDEAVREYLKRCSTHPEFLKWLNNEELIRNVVAVVDSIARGESPAPLLEFLRPAGEFKTTVSNNAVKMDTAGYKRYAIYVEVLTSLKSEVLHSLYYQLKSLINRAYRELGYPDGDFDNALIRAINILLKTPVVEGEIFLEKKVVSYAFEDSKLEQLLPAQKHLIRMGPENTRKIHSKLIEIARVLKIPPEKLVVSSQNDRE